ncbi:MAG: hypothetical protein Ct9H300mP18_05190 [Candidatus Neomarinimicrobiota bacterium]|nr:MAG: hypothetical protein Ct9H300mP18_05190 [Candidatus Neomarinimicrobiota bacterium]
MTQLRFVQLVLFITLIRSQTASEAIHLIENEIGYGARSLAMGEPILPWAVIPQECTGILLD